MYISYNWLKKYLPELTQIDITLLTKKLSSALAEVEKIIPKGHELKNIVAGEILSVQEHPTSPSHMIAEVNVGQTNNLNIVFAAKNKDLVTPGTKYPVCLVDGSVYTPDGDTKKIQKVEIDGITSEGMLCSPSELGLSDEKRGITIVSPETKVGENLLLYLQDYVFEIENKSLTHRPDCLSHKGLAREIATVMNIEFSDVYEPNPPVKIGDQNIKIKIEDTATCQRFVAISMQNITVGMSPTWMQILLYHIGTRPINNIVDISNYIMFDIGYPTHIYDLDKIKDRTLIVRKAKKSEKFVALNTKSYTLEAGVTVISDTENIQGLGGIIGGELSEISPTTQNILIESASWNMYDVRRAGMQTGVTTDASIRYSKGLSPHHTKEALYYAVNMVEDIAGGETSSTVFDQINIDNLENKRIIKFNLKSINRLIGIEVDPREIVRIFESLGITIQNKEIIPPSISTITDIQVLLDIPPHRQDLKIEQDIVEEVARVYGYDRVVPSLPITNIKPSATNQHYKFSTKVKQIMTSLGFDEILNYSFVSQALWQKNNLDHNKLLKITNSMSPELEYFRNELLPSLVEKAHLNTKHFDELSIFELNRVVQKDKNTEENIPSQPYKLSGIVVLDGNQNSDKCFEITKSKIEHLLQTLAIQYQISNLNGTVTPQIAKLFHPYKSAVIRSDQKIIGIFGDLHPQVQANFELERKSVCGFDIDYEEISKIATKSSIPYIQVRNGQNIKRDITFSLSSPKVEIGPILEDINNQMFENVTKINMINEYKSEKIHSVTFRLFIDNYSDKFLTEEDIAKCVSSVEQAFLSHKGLSK